MSVGRSLATSGGARTQEAGAQQAVTCEPTARAAQRRVDARLVGRQPPRKRRRRPLAPLVLVLVPEVATAMAMTGSFAPVSRCPCTVRSPAARRNPDPLPSRRSVRGVARAGGADAPPRRVCPRVMRRGVGGSRADAHGEHQRRTRGRSRAGRGRSGGTTRPGSDNGRTGTGERKAASARNADECRCGVRPEVDTGASCESTVVVRARRRVPTAKSVADAVLLFGPSGVPGRPGSQPRSVPGGLIPGDRRRKPQTASRTDGSSGSGHGSGE